MECARSRTLFDVFRMTLPLLTPLMRGGRAAAFLLLLSMLMSPSSRAAAGDTASIAPSAWLVGAVLGLIVLLFWFARRIRRNIARETARSTLQVSALIENSECLLWEAGVHLTEKNWDWKFTLH